jgi:thiamine pyrophosphate-dependent acetolactate synthase large subunit-like protein
MAQTVGDFFIERLYQWGVRRIYGYPGDGINGVFGALQRAEGKIEFIQARHEEMAAFMAAAHAKFTGELGVCIATSGPGASHLIGLKGICVDDPNRVAPAWEEALAADRPVVVEFKTDPEVPPLPPHITLKQAKAFAEALVKGDPEEGSVIVGAARQVLASVLPG